MGGECSHHCAIPAPQPRFQPRSHIIIAIKEKNDRPGDDLVVMGESKEKRQENWLKWQTGIAKYGLKVKHNQDGDHGECKAKDRYKYRGQQQC